MLELSMRCMNPRVVDFIIAIARYHHYVLGCASRKNKFCHQTLRRDFPDSPIVDRCTTALCSQNVVEGQGEELRRSDVWFVAAVNAQIERLVDVLLKIVEAERLVVERSNSSVVLNVSIRNKLLGVNIFHVPVEGFAFQFLPQNFSMCHVTDVRIVT